MNLEQRVAQLERQNRRLRRALIATVGGLVVVLGLAATGSFLGVARARALAAQAREEAVRAVQAEQQATQRMIDANEDQ